MAAEILDSVLLPMQKHIKPLNMNGMNGRMLRMPAPKKGKKASKREILVIYGHHASLERIYGIAAAFNDYGAVTAPDLPGFGGMDSFYKIGMKPTLDNLADYIASFIKLKYRNKKVTIAAMSLGFVIVTRMLQRYPELTDKVEILISIVGFTHHDEFILSNRRRFVFRYLPEMFKGKLPAMFAQNVIFSPPLMRLFYGKTGKGASKNIGATPEELQKAVEMEVILWRDNEIRTYCETTIAMFTLNNLDKQINLPVHHIHTDDDQYFDNQVVEQHMRIIFTDYHEHIAVLPNHAPSIMADKEDAMQYIPKSITKVLKK